MAKPVPTRHEFDIAVAGLSERRREVAMRYAGALELILRHLELLPTDRADLGAELRPTLDAVRSTH